MIILKVLEFWRENINCDLWLGWGDKEKLYKRDRIVLKIIKVIKDLSKLESKENNYSRLVLSLGDREKGSPRHPLYMPNESFLKPFDQ